MGSQSLSLSLVVVVVSITFTIAMADALSSADASPAQGWNKAHATFYGGSDASGTMGGACGYANLYSTGYGTATAALSTALFNDGAACGQCFKIMCDAQTDPRWCLPGKSVTVTATNFCPPNFALPNDNGGWCNPPLQHFDMAQPAWEQIAIYRGGIVPVIFQRGSSVHNQRTIVFRACIDKQCWWGWINIGCIDQGWGGNWQAMTRNWGANWQSNSYLNGQSLSFRVTTGDGKTLVFPDIAPSNWQFGQTFTSSVQF